MNKIGLIFPSLFFILVVLNNFLGWDPYGMNFDLILKPPGFRGFFGYDDYGRDILIRLINGFLVSFEIVVLATSISFLMGICLGCIAGYFRGPVDQIITSGMTIVQAFPGILLIIGLAAFLETSFWNILFALTVTAWIGFARIARSQTLSIRESDFVKAAILMGADRNRIIHKHIIPNILAPLSVELNFTIANLIVAEAGLAFLGLGLSSPFPSWGGMLRDSIDYLLVAPHYVIMVSLCMILMILSFNSIGEGLKKYINE
ncbi:MAG: ABC transporter permease [Proteobacteria bacterium]|nr:ABC transporter permease [Pseudomonadota bacterium]